MTRPARVSACLCLAALLVGCGPRAQDADTSTASKPDMPAWQGSTGANAYSVDGWKRGDKAAWEAQMRQRARGQNEYARGP